MKQVFLFVIFSIFSYTMYGQNTQKEVAGDSLSLDVFRKMLIGSNEIDSLYTFDKRFVYKTTISDTNGVITSSNEEFFFNSRLPHIQMITSLDIDSNYLLIDYNRKIVLMFETTDSLKRGVILPIVSVVSQLNDTKVKTSLLLGAKLDLENKNINSFECKRFDQTIDTLKSTFYLSSNASVFTFSTAEKISMTKMLFNDSTVSGLLVKWIITNTKSKVIEEKVLTTIDDVKMELNTKEYSILGLSGGLFAGLLEGSTYKRDTTVYVLPIRLDNKYGIIKYQGDKEETIVPHEYDECKLLSDSLIALMKEGSWQIYQVSKNKFLPNLDCINIERMGGLEISTIALQFPSSIWGLIDSLGNIISAPKYEDFVYESYFNIAKAKKNNYWGLVNKKGEEITPQIYDEISFYDGPGIAVMESGKWGVISYLGEIIVQPQYEKINGISDLITVKKNGKWGFIDRNNKIVIPFIYNNVNNFSQGLASVKKNNKWGFIDKKNQTIIPFLFDGAFYFGEDGRSRVIKGMKEFVIDKTGKCIEDCK
ncbi:WG repeat-containing protein [Runella sp. SP2]|uniref:WG repeat-containing protein n=1 Tax=Runella sp. SP2 TaxID=2268026 RepID=UPI0013DE533A|nr:WG repeat-containing protein [Runella sp. SP2]